MVVAEPAAVAVVMPGCRDTKAVDEGSWAACEVRRRDGRILAFGRPASSATRRSGGSHFTATSSRWINQVERWLAYVTDELIRRDSHASVQALEADIRVWIKAWNQDPKPFVWTKTTGTDHSDDLLHGFRAQSTSSRRCRL